MNANSIKLPTLADHGTNTASTVYIVEDDLEMRQFYEHLLKELAVRTVLFGHPSAILRLEPPTSPCCLLVDYRLPQTDGLALLQRLRSKGWEAPFLVVTGYGEVPLAVTAMQAGAVDFLEKPVQRSVLVSRIRQAIERDERRLQVAARIQLTHQRLATLTPRENEVLDLVVQGKLNRQIAAELAIGTKTVETHRANLTRKLNVDSVAQLVRLVLECQEISKNTLPSSG